MKTQRAIHGISTLWHCEEEQQQQESGVHIYLASHAAILCGKLNLQLYMANNLNTNLANISNQQGKEGDDAYWEVVLQGQCCKTSDTWEAWGADDTRNCGF